MNNESVTFKKMLNSLIHMCWIHQETNEWQRKSTEEIMAKKYKFSGKY